MAFRSGSEEVNIGDPISLGYITCTQKNWTVITRVSGLQWENGHLGRPQKRLNRISEDFLHLHFHPLILHKLLF